MIGQALFGGLGRGGRIEGVVNVGRIEEVEVVRSGHHAVVPGPECLVPGPDAPPGLDHGLLAKPVVQAFVPADGAFAEAGERRHDVAVEGRAVPSHLVASEVNELVGKHLGELGEERVHGAADLGIPDVEADVVYAEARTGPVHVALAPEAPIRMCRQPTRGMAGDIELGHDADRPVGGVVHEITQVGGRIGVGAGEFGVGVGAKPEALIVGQVQVKDVQLVERHHVEGAFEGFEGDEMPDRVDHHAPPGVVRRVANFGGVEVSVGDELRQGGQRREGAPLGRCTDFHRVAQCQTVLVRIGEPGNGLRCAVDVELDRQTPRRQPCDGASQTFGARALDSVRPGCQRPPGAGRDLRGSRQQTYRVASRRRQWMISMAATAASMPLLSSSSAARASASASCVTGSTSLTMGTRAARETSPSPRTHSSMIISKW